jgi:hypothetical protein
MKKAKPAHIGITPDPVKNTSSLCVPYKACHPQTSNWVIALTRESCCSTSNYKLSTWTTVAQGTLLPEKQMDV